MELCIQTFSKKISLSLWERKTYLFILQVYKHILYIVKL